MRSFWVGLGVSAISLVGLGFSAPVSAPVSAPGPDYTTQVQPIFQANCYRCHGGMNHKGHLSIQTRAGMLKGGMDGAVIVPGDPSKSLMVKLIRHEGPKDDPMPMPPPPRHKLSDADIQTITEWIRAGAIMPEDGKKP